MLHGRATEQAIIDRLLARARAGRSGVLVIRGEAGIGKTALLDYAAGAAASVDAVSDATPGDVVPPGTAGIRVLRAAGVQSEAELPFAGLHLLLGSTLERRFALPKPQRDALDSAFGLRPAGSYDRFLVGLAVLSLLAELAEDSPLACLVDDAQWLDRASAEALVFAARRLDAEGLAVVFTARVHDVPFAAPGLPELRLGGLDAAASAALLAEHGGAELTPEARDLILAEACGNPLGLIELSAAHLGESPNAVRRRPEALALTERLQQAFAGQVGRLAEPTQTLLLAAAADDSGDLGVVLEAAGALGVVASDLGPAEGAGLVRVADGTVRFRHPLVRAAVYQGAPLGRRLAVHRALADALRGPESADRRAWHLAAAATGPDEQVAGELERTAAKATARGGYAAAAAAYERAVQLSADLATQARRLALAAQAVVELGEFDRARSLAARAAGQATDPALQARLAGVHALADFAQGRLASAHRLLVEGAALSSELDRPRAARMLMNALHIAWFLGDRALLADTADRLQLLGGADGGSDTEPLAPLVQLMLWSVAQADERPTEGLPRLAEMVAAARRWRAGDQDDLTMLAMACLVTGRNA